MIYKLNILEKFYNSIFLKHKRYLELACKKVMTIYKICQLICDRTIIWMKWYVSQKQYLENAKSMLRGINQLNYKLLYRRVEQNDHLLRIGQGK